MSKPKKHHFVPQMLLNRFAYDGYLWHLSIERDEKLRRARPREIGHVNGGHTLIRLDGTRDHESLEKAMSSIEGEASAAITAIEAESSMAVVPRELAEPLAWLASLQSARNRARLGYIASEARVSKEEDPFAGTVGEIQSSLLRVAVMTVLETWAIRNDEFAHPKDQWDFVAHQLLGMRWDVMRYPDRSLAVSDAFAAQFGIRDDVQGDFERDLWGAMYGMNTPLWAARGVTVALTPRLAISLHRGDARRVTAAAAVNMHTIRSAKSFIAFPTDMNPDEVLPGWIDWINGAKAVRAALPKSL